MLLRGFEVAGRHLRWWIVGERFVILCKYLTFPLLIISSLTTKQVLGSTKIERRMWGIELAAVVRCKNISVDRRIQGCRKTSQRLDCWREIYYFGVSILLFFSRIVIFTDNEAGFGINKDRTRDVSNRVGAWGVVDKYG